MFDNLCLMGVDRKPVQSNNGAQVIVVELEVCLRPLHSPNRKEVREEREMANAVQYGQLQAHLAPGDVSEQHIIVQWWEIERLLLTELPRAGGGVSGKYSEKDSFRIWRY